MSLRPWKIVTGIALLLIAAMWFFFSRPGPSFRRLSAEAYFTRPTEITPGLQQLIHVDISGADWWQTEPVIPLGDPVSLTVKWRGEKNSFERHLLHIAPRPESDPSFHFWDQRVDWYTSASGKKKTSAMRLRPGRYVVRFFMETISLDRESEALPKVNLIAERPLIVAPPQDPQMTGILPGDEPRKRIPMIVSRRGPGLSKEE